MRSNSSSSNAHSAPVSATRTQADARHVEKNGDK